MSASLPAAPRAARELLRHAVPGLADRMLLDRIRREWAATVGPPLARRSEPLDLDAGTLQVGVDSSPALQELTLRAADLARVLSARYGLAVATVRPGLRRLAPVPGARSGPRAPQREAVLTRADADRIEHLAGSIADPGLAAAIRRVLVKDHLARRGRARPSQHAAPGTSPDGTA